MRLFSFPSGDAARRLAFHTIMVVAVFAGVYLPAVGGSFLSDDFRWVLESRVREVADVKRLFVDTTGFYRPVVALGFAGIEQIAGNDPRPYGIALFLLALACGSAIAALARALRLPAAAAVFAAGLWLLNPHGINMALLWVSGLTALCLVFFSVATATAVAAGRPLVASVLFMAALLSKEEAILLPIPLFVIAVLQGLQKRQLVTLGAGVTAAELLYFVLRSGSDAATPATAPAYYRFTFAPVDVLANAAQYADRSLTLAAAAVLLALCIVRRRPLVTLWDRRVIAMGLAWLVVGFGITVFLPVRSSLYVLMPSVGSAIAASVLAAALWRQASRGQRRALTVSAIILPLCLFPVLKARTERWTDLMRVANETLAAVAREPNPGASVVFVDDRGRRDNLENAFRALLPEAIELYTDRRVEVWLVPPPSDAGRNQLEPLPSLSLGWRYANGTVERIAPSAFSGQPAVRLR